MGVARGWNEWPNREATLMYILLHYYNNSTLNLKSLALT